MAHWYEITKTTLHHRRKGATNLLVQHRPFFAMMKEKGQMETGLTGQDYRWPIKVRRVPIRRVGFDTIEDHTFERHALHEECVLPWRRMEQTDGLSKADFLMNRGGDAVVKLFEKRQQMLEEDFFEQFPRELVTCDGNAPATSTGFHGIPSFFGHTGVLMADGKRMTPSDTYAGLSTAFGIVGGGTTEADDEYGVHTPTIVDYTGTGWTDGAGAAIITPNWKESCRQACRFGISKSRATNKANRAVNGLFLHEDMYNDFRDVLQEEENYPVSRGENSLLLKAGFTAFWWDGVEVVWDHDIPENTGYGLTFNDIALMSMQDQIVNMEQKWLMQNSTFVWMIDCYGNLRFDKVRTHFMLTNATAAAA